MTKPSPRNVPAVHHRVRTFFAAIFGMLALSLVLLCVLVVWANRTLTDTATYVQTVSPLVNQPAIQTFVGDKVSDQLLQNVDIADLAQTLLPPADANETVAMQTAQVRTIVTSSVNKLMTSPSFATLWHDTNKSAHAQLISQLNSNSSTISLDLNPAITGAIAQLKQTQLAPVADKIEPSPTAGNLNLKGGSIDKAHKFYRLFQEATLGILVLTLLLIGLSIWISTHHLKTLRRMLVGTSLIFLSLAATLQAPSIIPVHGSDAESIAAAKAFAHVLFHNLQVACIIIGIAGLVIAIGSKIYGHMMAKRAH